MPLKLDQLWAKTEPFQSVPTHSALCGIVAQVLLEEVLSPGSRRQLSRLLGIGEEDLSGWVGYFASLHDVGKIDGQFQWKWEEMQSCLEKTGLKPALVDSHAVRHEKTTDWFLKNNLWIDEDAGEILAAVLGAHHQGKSGRRGEVRHRVWNRLRLQLAEEMAKRFPHNRDTFPTVPEETGVLSVILLGLVILADWIASSEYFADAETWFPPSNREEAEKRVHQFLTLSGLRQKAISFGEHFTQVWPNIPAGSLRGLQEEVETLFTQSEERISLVLLEAPMGEGKTEAGVYAGVRMAKQWGKTGFYMGLPTAATSNQMAGRMETFLGYHDQKDTVRLLHSMAWLVQENAPMPRFQSEEEYYAASWLQPVRRGLLSPYGVGTVDQAMMAALRIKYGVLRLLGLAGKTLIIDELHAYDVYMSEILIRLLEWCKALEIPVVLLSATLPPEKKAQILRPYTSEPIEQAYPAVTAVTEQGKVLVRKVERTEKRMKAQVTLAPILHQPEQIADLVISKAEQGGCICVLVNTVGQAQEVYQALKKREFDGQRILFHARFPARQRDALEKKCIRLFGKDKRARPKRGILVATQVVEQSLDVDFDLLITSVAPIDLLLQRLGRVWRHGDTPRPDWCAAPGCIVMVPAEREDDQGDGFVYPKCLLNQSIHLLENRREITIPEEIPQLVAQGYDPDCAPPEELEAWLEHQLEEEVKGSQSLLVELSPPEKGFDPVKNSESIQFDDLERTSFLSAKTRLGEESVRLILLPAEEFDCYAQRAKAGTGGQVVEDVTGKEARDLMKKSVSVRAKWLKGSTAPSLRGRRRLEGVQLLRCGLDADGRLVCRLRENSVLISDPQLGVYLKEGE